MDGEGGDGGEKIGGGKDGGDRKERRMKSRQKCKKGTGGKSQA